MKKLIVKLLIIAQLLSLSTFNISAAEQTSFFDFDSTLQTGISYYNQGLYYESIAEVQGVCDLYWYYMTEEQQKNALWYLNNSKIKLADYSFAKGTIYFTSGLYYEARSFFESAVVYYENREHAKWKKANDYLYNTNEAIRELESYSLGNYENCMIYCYFDNLDFFVF